ncbi:hypothetical protein [Streptomyces sp. NPDC093105]|uniref:hypothetical protein n=1 Tax=Streptomyces sp. NPDC093105 TaxID=3366029 RepID=UPI0037F95024
MEARGSADEARVEFTLFTFATAEEASTTMKILAEHERKESAEHGEPAKPVTLDSGADETQAKQDGDSFEVVMRHRPGPLTRGTQGRRRVPPSLDRSPGDDAGVLEERTGRAAVGQGGEPDRCGRALTLAALVRTATRTVRAAAR